MTSPFRGGAETPNRAGGTDGDAGEGVAVLPDDSPVMTGYFSLTATFGTGGTTLTSEGLGDIFVARYNP